MAPVYHFRMPRPGEAGALSFNKANVTEFLKRWEEECDEVGYSDAQKCTKLPTYCAEDLRIAVESLEGFASKNWGLMAEEMRDLFRAYDRPLYNRESLHELVAKGQGVDLKLYVVTYAAMSNELIKRDVISGRQQVLEFIAGLGTHLRHKAFEFAASKDWKLTEDDTGSKEPVFTELQSHILDKAKSEQKNTAFERHFQSAPAAQSSPPTESTPTKATEDDERYLKLIEQMENLSLAIQTLQGRRTEAPGARSTLPPVGMRKSCYWCESTEHDRRGCPLFAEVLRSGKVKFNDVYHVIFVPTGEEIPLNREKGGQKELFEKLMAKIPIPTARSSANVIVAEPVLANLGTENSVVLATLYDDGSIVEEVCDVDVYEKRKRDEFSQAGRRNRARPSEEVTSPGQQQSTSGDFNDETAAPQAPTPHTAANPTEPKQKYQLLSKLNATKSIDDIGAKILDTPVALPLSEVLSVSGDLSTFIHE
jgi:phosphoserine phosphatase